MCLPDSRTVVCLVFFLITSSGSSLLIRLTNSYAGQKPNHGWKTVTMEEIKELIAVILNIGIIPRRKFKDYMQSTM